MTKLSSGGESTARPLRRDPPASVRMQAARKRDVDDHREVSAPGKRESVANGCARRSARGRIRVSSSPKGSVSNDSIRQRHDRRRLAHVSWDLIRPSSWGLGRRGSRGNTKWRKPLRAPTASYRSAGTEPGGAHDDDVETSEVGIVRERLLQPHGAGGRHLRLTPTSIAKAVRRDESPSASQDVLDA